MKGKSFFSSAILHTISIIVLTSFPVSFSSSSSPCSHGIDSSFDNPTQCLDAIREAATDKNRFWFGERYATNCVKQSEFSSECYNPISGNSDSLISRIFRRRAIQMNELKTFIRVQYKTHTGGYQACGNGYEIYKSRVVDIVDPLTRSSGQELLPFELLSRPRVTWDINKLNKIPNSPVLYTLAMVDAGYVTVNALYVNIAENSWDGGQIVVDYQAPINPTSNDNPYAFLLFVQRTSIDLSSKWLHELSQHNLEKFEEFLDEFDLEGPVGLSWFTVRADPFSADNHQHSPGSMNTCAQFVEKEFKKKTIPYLPEDTPDLNVYLDITFESPPIVFNCCCNVYSYEATTYKPNPIGDGEAKAWLMRSEAKQTFSFRKSTAFPLQSRDFKNELHTLIMVDPDSPFAIYGSKSRPYVHMLVTNIREGDFKSGQADLPYSGPWPPDPDHHTYYFLLFKQKGIFHPRIEDYAFMNCSGIFNGRCGFNMAAMIQDGDLALVGASWQLIKSTAYVRCVLVGLGVDESELCAEVGGYTPKCDRKNNNHGNSGSPYIVRPNICFRNWFLASVYAVLVFYVMI